MKFNIDDKDEMNSIYKDFVSKKYTNAFNSAKKFVENNDSVDANILFANICRLIYIADIDIDVDNDLLVKYIFTHYIIAIKSIDSITKGLTINTDLTVSPENMLYKAIEMHGSKVPIKNALYWVIDKRFNLKCCDIDKCISILSNMNPNDITIEDIKKSIS